jgi:hypothetical protein
LDSFEEEFLRWELTGKALRTQALCLKVEKGGKSI